MRFWSSHTSGPLFPSFVQIIWLDDQQTTDLSDQIGEYYPIRARVMDNTDEAILASLRDDARASLCLILPLALRLSRTMVRAATGAGLQQNGEILGLPSLTRSDCQGGSVRGLMMIEIRKAAGRNVITRTLCRHFGAACARLHSNPMGRWM